MSNTNSYLPIPERAWSRVENRCPNDSSSNFKNHSDIYYKTALINKGNVLQYKKNSTQLTKKQRYAQIAKGLWTNRTKTWATQSDTYTNPNMTSLKRVGYIEYSSNDITPGSPANPSGPYTPISVLNDPFNCPNFAFKDGGNLVCGTYENPCTGEVVDKTYVPKYYPTTDSDVPGPIQQLYWDPRLQTWYPKQRLTMNNSTDKWPINYKLFRSAIIPAVPVLSILSSTINSIELSWTLPIANCYPITQFNIFVNNDLYKAIPYTTSYTTILTGLNKGKVPYQIYIVSLLSGNTSGPSNIVTYKNEIYKNPLLSNEIEAAAAAANIAAAVTESSSVGSAIFNIFKNIYVIKKSNINNSNNAIALPDKLISEQQQNITILNDTSDVLTVLSAAPIYNIQYAPPGGTNTIELAIDSVTIFTYVYDSDNNLSIYANIS
jgi:hypothetical protein